MFRRWFLPILMLGLAALSVLILSSVAPTLLSKQLMFFGLGGLVFFFTAKVSFKQWLALGPYFYLATIFLLLATQIIGKVTRGAVSWIPLGPIHIEPSQLAVVSVGLVVSQLVVRHPLQNLKNLGIFAGLVLLPAGLIFAQPDLGSTIIYVVSMSSVFFLSETKLKYVLGIVVVAMAVVLVSWTFLLKPYQKQRVTSFLNVSDQATSASYNAIQSVIAVGSGQILGKGLGLGVQSHLRFLPERQTDFVFASFAEETGLIGSVLVVSLYIALTFFFFLTGYLTESRAGRYFCLLTGTMLAIQTTINIGMNIGILPITGITLPLISYGGSSVITICFQYGCVQSLLSEFRKKPALHIR